MSDWTLTLELSPESQRALTKYRAMPGRMARAIMTGLDAALEVGLQQSLKAHFTGKGPFPVAEHRLGVKTGLLRTSFLRSPARIEGSRITAGLGANTKYWLAHEFGFDGSVTVQAHQRSRARNAKGGAVRVRTALRSKKPHTFRTHSVAAHKRHVRIPERAPMRTGLDAQRENMQAIMSAMILRDLNAEGSQP